MANEILHATLNPTLITKAHWQESHLLPAGSVTGQVWVYDPASPSRGLWNVGATLSGGNLTLTGFLQAAAGLVGTATNDAAPAGRVGELLTQTTALTTAAVTSNTPFNAATITLTPGDWDVWGNVSYATNGGPGGTHLVAWISTASATYPGAPNGGAFSHRQQAPTDFNQGTMPAGILRVSVAVNTPVYVSGIAIFTGGTGVTAGGFIGARRRR